MVIINYIMSKLIKSMSSQLTTARQVAFVESNTLFVDGGHNKMTENEAWASVVNHDNKCMITHYKDSTLFSDLTLKEVELPVGKRNIVISSFDDVKIQQNNGAELLAMVIGLRIAEMDKTITTIKGDSDLIIKWWSKGKVNKTTKSKMDKRKIAFIEECKNLRDIFELRKGQIIKISGTDNKADLGYHK